MIKIGIIGAENSHATAFSKALNLPDADGKYKYDARVIRVYGEGDSAKELAKNVGVEEVTDDYNNFSDMDSVMVTTRRGSLHYKQIIKYIKEGKNVFIDKPYTVSVEECKELIAAVKKSGSLVCGGSACKYAPDVVRFAEKVKKLRGEGAIVSASLNFNIFMDIEYDGFFFYAAHLIEIADTLFGRDIKSVRAQRCGGSVVATVDYGDFLVTLHFTGGVVQSGCTLYTKEGVISETFDISTIFDEELKHFINMLETQKAPFAVDDILFPVVMADAIYRSYTQGITVEF